MLAKVSQRGPETGQCASLPIEYGIAESTDFVTILEFFPSSTKHHDSYEMRLPLFILFIDTTMLEARGLRGESF